MEDKDFIEKFNILMRQARSHQKTIKWIHLHIGKGLSFGGDIQDESGKIIFSMKDTPAKSPQRLLACLLMEILTSEREVDADFNYY